MEEYILPEKRAFLISQHRFLQLYALDIVAKNYNYGYQIVQKIQEQFEKYGYRPRNSEIYRALHDLVHQGILYQEEKKAKPEDKKSFQMVKYYKFAAGGREKAEVFRKQIKFDLDLAEKIIKKALRDHF